MEKYPLISAVIIHYNNDDFLYETIDSVLCQDYPNIELLISDDCSLEGFDVDKVIKHINKNRRDNLKRTIININPKNLGTVKNLETIRAKEQGEFELLIAGDDIWHDSGVFSAFARRFEELGPEAEWITSQIEMCDEKLQVVKELFVKPDVIDMIDRKAYKELLSYEVSTVAFPSAGTAFKQTFFNKISNLSDDYDLIEDYSSQLRALRMGIPVYYLDKITVRHRDGGVSHGNKRNNNKIWIRYLSDFLRIFEKEIFPYEKDFSAESFNKAKARYTWYKSQFEAYQKTNEQDFIQQDLAIINNRTFKNFVKNIIPRLKSSAQLEKIKNDIKVLILLLISLTFFRLGHIFYVPFSILIQFVVLSTCFFTIMIAFRIILFVLILVKNKINLIRG